MRVLVVDDEPLARRRLIRMLGRLGPNIPPVEVVGEAGDGVEALTKIKALSPDLLFLDIRMPELDGLTLARQPALPPIVFTTAYSDHALEAFEVGAVDYLLKPVVAERLEAALLRVLKSQLSISPAALAFMLRAQQPQAPKLVRVTARHKGVLHVFDPSLLSRFYAEDKYTALEHEGQIYYLDESLNALEETLAELGFLRVHRGELINLAHVRALHGDGKGATVTLAGGQTAAVSRRYLGVLKARLNLKGRAH